MLDPRTPRAATKNQPERTSRWAGMQSDMAIVAAMAESFPQLRVSTVRTLDELLASNADAVVIVSYKTQPSYEWYDRFFGAMRTLEARGVPVYPSADFKQLISSKAKYMRILREARLPLCPTEIVERAACVDASGAIDPELAEAALGGALTSLGFFPAAAAALPPRLPAFRVVTKPSNADGGFGVAFWEGAGEAPTPAAAAGGAGSENAGVQCAPGADATAAAACDGIGEGGAQGSGCRLLRSLQLRTLLTNGCDVDAPPELDSAGAGADAADAADAPFVRYLRDVMFTGGRPHMLVQPLVPQLGQNFEIKIYFLKREPFFASLVYGKERLLARVVRPSTHPQIWSYLGPMIAESKRALDALPSDGPGDPKILMRVDWGVGEPLLPEDSGPSNSPSAETSDAPKADGSLKRALVRRANSLAAPNKRLRKSMEEHGSAPLAGSGRHFINEVEVHPGFYVDWDETPDETIGPLANAVGEYVVGLIEAKRGAA